MDREPTISELLRARGYGHRPNRHGAHAIYRLDTGEVVDHCHAGEAVERFCRDDARGPK